MESNFGNSSTALATKMSQLLETVWEKRDKRVDGWFLMSSPLPTVAIVCVYIYLVKIWGPNFMKHRKPMNLKSFMLVYNVFQVLLSAYIFIEGLRAGWLEYSLTCQPVDYTVKGDAMLHCAWVCLISKYIDLIDTFCFVARKKFNQVSLLHVYHHAIMPINVWLGVRFLPGGHGTFFGLVNALVHVIMYTYYLIAGLGPAFQKYLWWKVYVTKLQLTQFVIILFHAAQLLVWNECNYPIFFAYCIVVQAIIFLCFFCKFYIKAYLHSNKKLNRDENDVDVKNGKVVGSIQNVDGSKKKKSN